ncbi:MAG TPA: DUF4349 domain-containing protein [Aliidongia sp.]|nr:DUF4349 domain-containing protein [Aliidongia sp.]
MRLTGTVSLTLALSACDPGPSSAPLNEAGSAASVSGTRDNRRAAEKHDGPKLAYSNQLAFEMPSATVDPRFRRARDLCLEDTARGCVLIAASIQLGNENWAGFPRASLQVRLPHGQVEPFEEAAMAPLPGEAAGAVTVKSRSTKAEDLTEAITDGDRRLSELTNFRDRLTELAKHADAKVEDLIKIESSLAETQSQIEALTAQQQHLADRVATELLDIDFQSRNTIAAASNPVALVFKDAGQLLSRNVAEVLRVAIASLPWLFLAGLFAWLARASWRLFRRRRPSPR